MSKKTIKKTEIEYDFINPNHYKKNSKEVIEMMIDIYGKEITANHCELSAFKYRMRIGHKPNESIDREIKKIQWYENKAVELRTK